ncbi:MAG: hypothetical protein ABIE74_12420 [Pseudomonadota bacterium]
MPNITTFDTSARYIFLPVFVTTRDGRWHKFDAILCLALRPILGNKGADRIGLLQTI